MEVTLRRATVNPLQSDVIDINSSEGGIQLRGNCAREFRQRYATTLNSSKNASERGPHAQWDSTIDVTFNFDANQSEKGTGHTSSTR